IPTEPPVRNNGFPGCVSAVSGPAARWQIHPALVWWQPVGLDDLHTLLPGHASGWVRLCAWRYPVCPAHGADDYAPGGSDCWRVHASDRSQPKLDSNRLGESNLADSRAVVRLCWRSVCCAGGDGTAASGVVCPGVRRSVAVSTLCLVQRRIADGSVELS